MKRKITALCVVIAMLAVAIIGGTMAYFTDTDEAVNVMVMGNVKIEQIEQEWNETKTALQDFTQNKPLFPYVGKLAWETTDGFGNAYRRFTMNNVVDKYVSVENTGKSTAYVRTLVALEVGEHDYAKFDELIGISINSENGTTADSKWTWEDIGMIEIGGNNFYLKVATYGIELEPKVITEPSLLQVYLVNTATNEDAQKLDGNGNGTYDIVCFTQAVQAKGFENADIALDTAFGEITTTEHPLGNIEIPVSYSSKEEAIKSLTELPDGTDIKNNVNSITYGKPSDYPEIVSGNYETTVDGAITTYYVPVTGTNKYDIYILSDNKIAAPKDSSSLFAEMKNVTEIDTSNLDMSNVENALCMFLNCTNLETLDVEDWDVSNVTNMQSMFYGCNKLDDLDMSNWDTSNCTNMRMVFFRCYELSNDSLKTIENWDVSNVTNFYSMFKHARGLTELDLSAWDTSSATNMSHMFANIGGLERLDLSSFDTSKVTDMSWMFYDASKLTVIYVGDKWSTASIDPTTPTCFYNNQSLVGGNGTTWLDVCDMANPARPWESSAKITNAIVDGGASNPGLLTYKASN